MARQHFAGGRHVERAPAPAADARLWQPRVIVRHHGVDDDLAVVTLAQNPRPPRRARLTCSALGISRRAVAQRPAVILHVRESRPGWRRAQVPARPSLRSDRYWRGAPTTLTVSGIFQNPRLSAASARALRAKGAVIAGRCGRRFFGVLSWIEICNVIEPGIGELLQRIRGDGRPPR